MLKYFVLFVALLFAVAYASEETPVEIEPYAATCVLTNACFNGRRYFFENKTKRKRDEAVNFCADIGMSLVTVDNCEENTFIYQFIKEMNCAHEHFWTSGYKTGDTWTWPFIHKDIIYTNWKVGEPNNKSKKEFCLQYRGDFVQWNDENCDSTALYICESNQSC